MTFQIFYVNHYQSLHKSHSSLSKTEGNNRNSGILKLNCCFRARDRMLQSFCWGKTKYRRGFHYKSIRSISMKTALRKLTFNCLHPYFYVWQRKRNWLSGKCHKAGKINNIRNKKQLLSLPFFPTLILAKGTSSDLPTDIARSKEISRVPMLRQYRTCFQTKARGWLSHAHSLTKYLFSQVPSWLQESFPLVPLHWVVQSWWTRAQGCQVSSHPAKQSICCVQNGVQHNSSARHQRRRQLPSQSQEKSSSKESKFQWLFTEEFQGCLHSLKFRQFTVHSRRWLFLSISWWHLCDTGHARLNAHLLWNQMLIPQENKNIFNCQTSAIDIMKLLIPPYFVLWRERGICRHTYSLVQKHGYTSYTALFVRIA